MQPLQFGAIYGLNFRNVGVFPPENEQHAEELAAVITAHQRGDALRESGFKPELDVSHLPRHKRAYEHQLAKQILSVQDGKHYLVDGAEWDYLKALYRAAVETIPQVTQADGLELGQRAAMFQTATRGVESALVQSYLERDQLAGTLEVEYEINPKEPPTSPVYVRVKNVNVLA